MPVKPQDIKTQESNSLCLMSEKLVTCQQKIEEIRKSLQTKTSKFEKKFGESISRCGLDLRKVLSFGFEYSRIITETYKEASGFFKSKVQQKIGLLSDDDDEIPDGMRTPKLSPRSSEKGLLSGFPLGWFDLPWPVKPIEQEFEEFEQKYGLGKVHQE